MVAGFASYSGHYSIQAISSMSKAGPEDSRITVYAFSRGELRSYEVVVGSGPSSIDIEWARECNGNQWADLWE